MLGFLGEQVKSLGKIELDVFECIRVGKKQAVEPVEAMKPCPGLSVVKSVLFRENPVLVKKGDGSWRMCIDFKNINSACPKDYYPLHEIDLKIESVMGFPLKCLLDAYKGYHQNLEAYVNDIVVKSKSEREMIADVAEIFDNIRRINMKLKPKKCSLGWKKESSSSTSCQDQGYSGNEVTQDLGPDARNIPLNHNQKDDVLSKLASVAFDHLTKEILVEHALKGQVGSSKGNLAKILLDNHARGRKGGNMQIHSSNEEWMWLGPLPEAPGKVKFVIVAIDYFTKWIEAKPLAKTTGKEVKNTLSDNIVCRFGLLRIIVTDNETNFVNDPFKSWCKKLNIMQINTAVTHPQYSGLVERENRSLIEGIKTRLTFGSESVILEEIGMPAHRTMMIKEGIGNEEEMRLNLC
nr:hypothetical protein [Tanacetum cinerariifolium]